MSVECLHISQKENRKYLKIYNAINNIYIAYIYIKLIFNSNCLSKDVANSVRPCILLGSRAAGQDQSWPTACDLRSKRSVQWSFSPRRLTNALTALIAARGRKQLTSFVPIGLAWRAAKNDKRKKKREREGGRGFQRIGCYLPTQVATILSWKLKQLNCLWRWFTMNTRCRAVFTCKTGLARLGSAWLFTCVVCIFYIFYICTRPVCTVISMIRLISILFVDLIYYGTRCRGRGRAGFSTCVVSAIAWYAYQSTPTPTHTHIHTYMCWYIWVYLFVN